MKTIVANVVRTLLDDNYMHDILKNQMKEEPVSFSFFSSTFLFLVLFCTIGRSKLATKGNRAKQQVCKIVL